MSTCQSSLVTLSRFATLSLCLSIAGCNPNANRNSSSSGRAETSSMNSPRDSAVPWNKLVGTWKGSSYRDADGIFHRSKPSGLNEPGESDLAAEVDLLLEIEEKFLSFKGVEICHLTLFLTYDDVEKTTKRDFYRMIPDAKIANQITLRGSGGEYQIRLLEDDQLQLQGESRLPGVGSLLRNLHATLKRSNESSSDPVDVAAESEEPIVPTE